MAKTSRRTHEEPVRTKEHEGLRRDVLQVLGILTTSGLLGCQPQAGGNEPDSPMNPTGPAAPMDPTGPAVVQLPSCETPTPIMRETQGQPIDTGWLRCQDGRVLRQRPVDCFDIVQPSRCTADLEGSCRTNADCTERPHGVCAVIPPPQPSPLPMPKATCACTYGCENDEDCDAGQLCLCSGFGTHPGGRCVQANCRKASDCDSGICEHATEIFGIGCPGSRSMVGCRSQADRCVTAMDCPSHKPATGLSKTVCSPNLAEKTWTCKNITLSCGRPFWVNAQIRCAPTRNGASWSGTQGPVAPHKGLNSQLRAAMAAHWIEMGQMEHASIAAFGRVIFQLLSLGAPPRLLVSANRALADEIRHAKICFEFASEYLDTPVEPGPLTVNDCLNHQLEPLAVLMNCFEEACLGETIAFFEAHRAAQHCEGLERKAALLAIAQDEREHAVFGWSMLRWVWHQLSPSDKRSAHRLLWARIEELGTPHQPRASPHASDSCLHSHGKLSDVEREAVREMAVGQVVIPCAMEFLRSQRRARFERSDRSHTDALVQESCRLEFPRPGGQLEARGSGFADRGDSTMA